ncbi:MAG TPA: DMT family transporter [bacterium]|nr:DMT family transporter [bacterium]
MKKITPLQTGIIALAIAPIIQASMGIWARYLDNHFLLFQQVYLRMIVACILSTIVFHRQISWKNIRESPRRDKALILFRASASYLIGIPLFTLAVNLAKLSNIAFIDALPMTALLGIIILRERLTLRHVGFLVTAFLGVLLISLKDPLDLTSWGLGELLELISLVFFGLGYISRKWLSPRLNNYELTAAGFLTGIPLVFTASLLAGEGLPSVSWSMPIVGIILIAGACNVAITFLSNVGFQHVPAVLGSTLLNTLPLYALIYSYLLYTEIPNTRELTGGMIILISAYGMTRLVNKK